MAIQAPENLKPQDYEAAYMDFKMQIMQYIHSHKPGRIEEYTRFRLEAPSPEQPHERHKFVLEQMMTAVLDSAEYKGTLNILFGDEEETVYKVEKGQILADPLGLSAFFKQEYHKEFVRDLNETINISLLVKDISGLIKMVNNNEASQELRYENDKYLFKVEKENLAVIDKTANQKILTESGFTENASQDNIEELVRLGEGAEVLQQSGQSQNPVIKFKI